MRYSKQIFSVCFLFCAVHVIGQDVDLDKLLDEEMAEKNKNKTEYTTGTFKSSRLINGHTVETTGRGVLDFKISHRFGTLDEGPENLFGVDHAVMRIGADYGINDRLTIGMGRSTLDKEYDAFLKYRLLWQSNGKNKMPFSLTLLSSALVTTNKDLFDDSVHLGDSVYLPDISTSDKLSYVFQMLLARKFSNGFSMQLMPTMVHSNYVPSIQAPMNFFSIGAGARIKLTQRSGLIGEYYHQFPGSRLPSTHDAFSIGYEIETGGHVFHLTIGNAPGMNEKQFVTNTQDPLNFSKLRFGFNISRVFTLKKPKVSTVNMSSPVDSSAQTYSQENKTPQADTNGIQYAEATFKTSRLINGHTVETTQRGVLDFKITHRFGTLNSGAYEMFGLDHASMRVGADYGITDRFTVGFGRSTSGENVTYIGGGSFFEKEYDGFLKYKVLRQSTGEKVMPVTLTLLSSVMFNAINYTIPKSMPGKTPSGEDTILTEQVKPHTSDRFYYAFQALIGRKFCDAFSLQVVPTMVHYNIVEDSTTHNDLFSVGVGARFRLTPRSSINVEYYYRIPGYHLPGTYNSFAIGYEIETGGHVFQLQFTNSYGMVERSFINETRGQWGKGDIHFGFNISRVFGVKKQKG